MATPGEVDFGHVRFRDYLGNLLNERGGVFAHVDGDARKLLKELLHCRNPDTGKCFPSWDYLAGAIGDCERNVGYILGRLDAGPSRQSDGRIVEGHGLIWRRSERCGFRRLPTQYGVTCRLLILAGLVLPHNCMECRCGPAWGADKRGLISSGSSDLSLSLKNSQNKGEPRTRARAPFVKSAPRAAPESDPTFAAFVATFERQRLARYGDNEHGVLSADNRAKLTAYLADLVGGAWAWAVQEGVDGARAEVAAALFDRLARLWLDWPGSSGLLRERRHPIGLLIGDLEKFGRLARASWKRAQHKAKTLAEVLHDAMTSPAGVEQLKVTTPEAWPQLDAEALAELAELREGDGRAERAAFAQLGGHAPAPRPASRLPAPSPPPAVTPIARVDVRRVLPAPAPSGERKKLAANQAQNARAVLAALGLPRPQGSTPAGVEPPTSSERRTETPAPRPRPTTTEDRPRIDRGGIEADTAPTPGTEAPREATEAPLPPRVRRPASRPSTGASRAPRRRPDAWRAGAAPDAPPDDDDPPDE